MPPQTRSAVKRGLATNYNARGLPALPLELLHQIVSHLKGAAIPCIDERPLESPYRERREALRALCRVCRSLRAIVLPLFWENLEACTVTDRAVKKGYSARVTLLAKEVFGLLDLIVEGENSYASYVKVVNVAIEPKFADEALYLLAHALKLMPNVHTIQIICKGSRTKFRSIVEHETFREAFKSHAYPSIRRVILPYQASSTFASFPKAVDVYMNVKNVDFCDYVDDLARACPELESLGWIESSWESRSGLVVEKFPNIRRLEYHVEEFSVEEVRHLANLTKLEEVTLIIGFMRSACEEKANSLIEAAQTALAASGMSRKQLKVIFPGEMMTLTFDGTTIRRLNFPSALKIESVLQPTYDFQPNCFGQIPTRNIG